MDSRRPVEDWAVDFDPQWTDNPRPIWDDLRSRCPVATSQRFEDGDHFRSWIQQVLIEGVRNPAAAIRAVQEMNAYFKAQVERRSADPGDDLISYLTQGRHTTWSEGTVRCPRRLPITALRQDHRCVRRSSR